MIESFAHIVGNDHVKKYLVRMVEKNAVANSLLFAGPSGIGKSLFAEAFARILVGKTSSQNLDIYHYHPEGKIGMHSIDSMRKFSEEVYMPPYDSPWKVFILHDADRMLPTSANALLKTFEEPAPKSIIIFLSSNPEALLPTLLSRCRTIRFHAVPSEDISTLLQQKYQLNSEEALTVAIQAKGSVGNAFRFVEQSGDPLRALVLSILVKGRMATYTQLMEAARSISDSVEKSRELLEEEARTAFRSSYPEGLTATQQQSIDKEIDGVLAMYLNREADAVFNVILSWHRDMQLLQANGNPSYLFHPDYLEQCKQALARGNMLPMDTVQKSISQAKLSLERSTPFYNCLENLFLQLNLL